MSRRSFADNATGTEAGRLCRADECLNQARSGGWCWGHAKQVQRAGQTRTLEPSRPLMLPLERLRKAALDYADADTGDDAAYRRADDNHCAAAIGYAESRGYVKARSPR